MLDPIPAASTEARDPRPPPPKTCDGCGSKPSTMSCSSCLGPAYCSKACQTAHWSAGHKSACGPTAMAAIGDALELLGGRRGLTEVFQDAKRGQLPLKVELALDKVRSHGARLTSVFRPLRCGFASRSLWCSLGRRGADPTPSPSTSWL
jgi:hypothetical protein